MPHWRSKEGRKMNDKPSKRDQVIFWSLMIGGLGAWLALLFFMN